MSASIVISVPDLQSLVAASVANFNLVSVTFKEALVLELSVMQHGEVQLTVLRKDIKAVMDFLVAYGICFRYIS